MLKKIKIISNIIGWIVFTFLLCFLFILISPKLPIKNVPKTFIVASGSMEPIIKTGSVAFVKEVNSKTIKTGDIIAFTSPNDPKETILHRVALISSTNPLTFKTKGDNNNGIDAWDVMGVGVKGTYITAVPYLGYIGVFIRQPLGFGLIVGIPALIFIIFQLLNIKKAIAEEIDRKVSQKIADSKKTDSATTILKTLIFLTIFSTLFSFTSIRTIKAVFSDTVTISGINISIADLTKPLTPSLVSPANNTVQSTKDLVMKWSNVNYFKYLDNSVYYIYQSSHSSEFSPLTYQSNPLINNQISAPGTPDGTYYWRVKACFTADNCSDWSETWLLTVDSKVPINNVTLSIKSETSLINPVETSIPSETPTPTPISTGTPTLIETPTLTPTETPVISLTPTETPIITSTPTETITPTPAETITPTPTTTPIPTSVPTPIPTETPVNVENDSPVTINPTGSQIITKVFNC